MSKTILENNLNSIKSSINNNAGFFPADHFMDILTKTCDYNDGCYVPKKIYKLKRLMIEPCVIEIHNFTARLKSNAKNIYLHSKYAPENESCDFISSINIKILGNVVVYGLGIGYHIRKLLGKMNDSNTLLIIEPSIDLLCELIYSFDYSDIICDPRVSIRILGTEGEFDSDELATILTGRYSLGNFFNLQFYALLPYRVAYPEPYLFIISYLKNTYLNNILSLNTVGSLSFRWLAENIKNMIYLPDSIIATGYENAFVNKPVILVAAGPSLDKNIDDLKKAEGHAVIICMYTAYRALIKHDIKPDFVIAVDVMNHMHEKGSSTQIDVPFIYILNTSSVLLKNCTKSKIYATIKNDIFMRIVFDQLKYNHEQYNILHSFGSVAVTALSFALMTGADPIIFVGQDLAFTNEAHHAQNTYYDHVEQVTKHENDIFLRDVHGGTVRTDYALLSFLQEIEKIINDDNKSRVKERLFIDATEGGALIKGTSTYTLADTIDKYCSKKHNISEIQNNVTSQFKVKKDVIEALADSLDENRIAIERLCVLADMVIETGKLLQDKLNEHGIEKNNQKHMTEFETLIDFTDHTTKTLFIEFIDYIKEYDVLSQTATLLAVCFVSCYSTVELSMNDHNIVNQSFYYVKFYTEYFILLKNQIEQFDIINLTLNTLGRLKPVRDRGVNLDD